MPLRFPGAAKVAQDPVHHPLFARYYARISVTAETRMGMGGVRDRLSIVAESETRAWVDPDAGPPELDLRAVLVVGGAGSVEEAVAEDDPTRGRKRGALELGQGCAHFARARPRSSAASLPRARRRARGSSRATASSRSARNPSRPGSTSPER